MKCFRFARATHVLAAGILAAGWAASPAMAAEREHAALIRESNLYSSPNTNAEKLLPLERGRDLIVVDRSSSSSQPWLKVLVAPAPPNDKQKEMTGWVPATVAVTASTMNADLIIYGEAVNSEHEAVQRHGRRSAAEDALRLYQRVAEFFPTSSLGGEATWRYADIRWQLDRAKSKGPADEQLLQAVVKRFPGTKWADLAAFDLLDNKMCPSWNGLADCPLKESLAYEQYAREHPQSPKFAEALYNAAWRQAVIAAIFRNNSQKATSTAAHDRALALAQEVTSQLHPDWKTRAATLIYKLQENIPVYGVQQ
jgi:hypothetical protein